MNTTEFDDIRPYRDEEIPAAMQRIADDKLLVPVADFIWHGRDMEDVKAMIRGITTIDEFQMKVMYDALFGIIAKSITDFTYSGTEYLSPDKGYTFVSNHRDITLDASLLQHVLFTNHLPTSEITFGSNLMKPQIVVDIGRSNRMFKVVRKSNNLREFMSASIHLSQYMRNRIREDVSVWIAQRNGRTKDGNDMTDQGLMKMFGLSGEGDNVSSFEELHIVPVSISYQFEPCDILKTRELYVSRKGEHYVKSEMEDLNSILTGIMQPKGKVNISICKPIEREDLESISHLTKNDFNHALAKIVDRRIHASYKLFNTNYIAHDIRSNSNRFAEHYDTVSRKLFEERLHQMQTTVQNDWDTMRDILLGIYANPVDNKMNNN